MNADRRETDGARRAFETANGFVLRATRRGALVLETENARRMMRRLSRAREATSPAPREDGETAPVAEGLAGG